MNMKTKGIATLLISLLIGCDEVKTAYNQTFHPQSESNEALEAKYNAVFAQATGKSNNLNPPPNLNYSKQNLEDSIGQNDSIYNLSGNELNYIRDELIRMFDGKMPKVLTNTAIYFHTDHINILINDPNNIENVDRYTYSYTDQKWAKDKHYKLSAKQLQTLPQETLPLSIVDFSGLRRLIEGTIQNSNSLEEAKIQNYAISYLYLDGTQTWDIGIETPRGDYIYSTTNDGIKYKLERK